MLHFQELTGAVIKIFYDVYNELGYGFLEKVYQNAIYIELISKGYKVEAQRKIKVYYKGEEVGYYIADLIINDILVLELKACEVLHEDAEYQLLNYLKTTECEIGLILNFGRKPEFIRKVFHNHQKYKSYEKSV